METVKAKRLALDWIDAWATGEFSLLKLAKGFDHKNVKRQIVSAEKLWRQ